MQFSKIFVNDSKFGASILPKFAEVNFEQLKHIWSIDIKACASKLVILRDVNDLQL